MTTQDEGFSLLIPVREIVRALEREAENTDTDPRWRAARELRRKLDELRADAERWRTIIHLRRTSHRWMIELYGNAMEPEKWIAYPHGTYYSTAEGAIDGAAGDVALTSKRGDRDEP